MILDKVLNGVLDQGNGCVILFDEDEEDVSPVRAQYLIITLLTNAGCGLV